MGVTIWGLMTGDRPRDYFSSEQVRLQCFPLNQVSDENALPRFLVRNGLLFSVSGLESIQKGSKFRPGMQVGLSLKYASKYGQNCCFGTDKDMMHKAQNVLLIVLQNPDIGRV